MIVGALFVKKITEKIAYYTILKYVSISLSICMITLGIPVIDVSLQFASIAYVCFYVGIMLCLGICIACIDIPLMYFMQKEIPDEYRGRVLSIGFSIGKMMFPVAMITSGILLKLLPVYVIPITGGMAFLLVHMCSAKKMKVELPSKSMNI